MFARDVSEEGDLDCSSRELAAHNFLLIKFPALHLLSFSHTPLRTLLHFLLKTSRSNPLRMIKTRLSSDLCQILPPLSISLMV